MRTVSARCLYGCCGTPQRNIGALSWYMAVLFRQYTENICFLSKISAGGSVIGGFYWLFLWLCLSLWLIQDSNWKGRVLWKLFGGLATILQNWISCNEQKMREAHITRRGINFYLLIFIEKKLSTVKLNTAFLLVFKGNQSLFYTWGEAAFSKGSVIVCGCFISTVL